MKHFMACIVLMCCDLSTTYIVAMLINTHTFICIGIAAMKIIVWTDSMHPKSKLLTSC